MRPSTITIPCLPTWMSSLESIFCRAVSTEISIFRSSTSPARTGGNRGSWNAACSAISETASARGILATICPIQPRSTPFLYRVTKAPLGSFSFREAVSTRREEDAPEVGPASIAFLAIVCSSARSSLLRPRSMPTFCFSGSPLSLSLFG